MKVYNYLNSNIKIYNDKQFKVEIKTNRLYIKSYSDSDNDKQLYFKLFKDAESTKLYGEGGPFSNDNIMSRLDRWSNRLNNNSFGIGLMIFECNDNDIDEANNNNLKFIGHCILAPSCRDNTHGEVEYAILLLNSYWNKGYGSEISNCIVNEYSDVLNKEGYRVNGELIQSVYATARLDNKGSNSVLIKIGMKQFDQKVIYGSNRNMYIKPLY